MTGSAVYRRADLDLCDLDELALAGAASMLKRGQQRNGVRARLRSGSAGPCRLHGGPSA